MKNLKVGVFETDFKQVPFVFRLTTCTYSESCEPVENLCDPPPTVGSEVEIATNLTFSKSLIDVIHVFSIKFLKKKIKSLAIQEVILWSYEVAESWS